MLFLLKKKTKKQLGLIKKQSVECLKLGIHIEKRKSILLKVGKMDNL